MKALTLWQPWASLIAYGEKTIETRTWTTTYRGPLAIHAGVRWDSENYGPPPPDRFSRWPPGRIVALATLADVRAMRPEDAEPARCGYEEGRVAWILEAVRQLPDIPRAKGRQGLWTPSAELAETVRNLAIRAAGLEPLP